MIGIVYISDIQGCPYIDKYLNILDEQKIEYEVVFWNRENKEINYPSNYLWFSKISKFKKHPFLKVIDFIQFGVWLRRTITNRKYDKLILLSTLSGTFIANTLLRKYPNRYIFDIRDYSYEKIKPFFRLEEKLIKESYFTCISSQGFKEFLPKGYPYIMAHNFIYNDLQFQNKFIKKEKGHVINVVWNGSIRYFDHQSQIIDKLKNDSRFNMIYHGTGPEIDMFKNYCDENNISNVKFTGAYVNSQKSKLLNDADILNNSYGTKKEMEVKYAIANKYYDGLNFGIPQLVEVGTFKEVKVEELGVGIGLDVSDKDFADKLYEYYFNIDGDKFNNSCDKEINNIINEDQLYLKKIKEFI